MKKFIIIFCSVLCFSISLSSQTTDWGKNIKRLENIISSQELIIQNKAAKIDSISFSDTISTMSKNRQVLALRREIKEIRTEIEASKSVIKTYQNLIEKEQEDKLFSEQKAKKARETEEREAERKRLQAEKAKKREEQIRQSVRNRINELSQQCQETQKESN